MNNILKIKKFLKNHNGYILTADFVSLGISKSMIPYYIKLGIIRKIEYGIYIDNNLLEDDFYVLQIRYPEAIISYNSAFYLLNLTPRVPEIIDVSIKRKQRIRGNFNVHYLSLKYYDVGITETVSQCGNPVKIYNAERCICDMIRSKEEFDVELQNQILNNYFDSKDKDVDKLLEYAKIFNIYEKIDMLVEVFMGW